MRITLLLVALAICPSACASPPPLRQAVETHLRAVRTRNVDALLPTLTGGSDLRMILPSGFQYTTRAQYVDFHRQWFASDDNGRFDPAGALWVQNLSLFWLVKRRWSRAYLGPT